MITFYFPQDEFDIELLKEFSKTHNARVVIRGVATIENGEVRQ